MSPSQLPLPQWYPPEKILSSKKIGRCETIGAVRILLWTPPVSFARSAKCRKRSTGDTYLQSSKSLHLRIGHPSGRGSKLRSQTPSSPPRTDENINRVVHMASQRPMELSLVSIATIAVCTSKQLRTLLVGASSSSAK
ncbi:hypothetical protein CUC08_Gglean006889 [Alternaria sp. MG1]|nr:hypothetical protein CUC08_Gglean006889 [Alternaria sp. MG1]